MAYQFTTDNGVSYDILYKSMPSGGMDGATAEILYRCDWGDIEDFLDSIFTMTTVAGMGYTITTQARHPDWNWFRAVSWKIDPTPPAKTSLTSDDPDYSTGANITITYQADVLNTNFGKPGEIEPPGGTYISIHTTAGFEMMAQPTHAWRWTTDGAAITQDMDQSIVVPTSTHILTWANVPLMNVPWTPLGNLRGTVNSNTFHGADAETLLYMGYEREFTYSNTGEITTILRITFAEKRIVLSDGTVHGWNSFPRNDGTWDKPYNPQTMTRTYRQFDFAPLILLGT